jgi:Mg2+/Co2+ transporter CorB
MELVNITPEDSIVPVYLEVLGEEEQAARDAEQAELLAQEQARQAEVEAKEAAKISGMNKLMALGLTEEEAKALTNGS